ncbi:MAG: cytochrome P450 family protein [Candidatus Flexifilum sp.]
MTILDLNAPEALRDPHRLYAELRRRPDLARVDQGLGGPAYLITRYDDALFVLKDPRFVNDARKLPGRADWSDKWYIPAVLKRFASTMALVDEPDHTRLRTLVHRAFTPQRVEQMRAGIEALAHDLLDRQRGRDVVDFMTAFAVPLPLTVIGDLMGISQADRADFRRWMANTISDFSPRRPLALIPKLLNAFALNRLLKRIIAERRARPTDDLTTALVQAEADGDRFSEDELLAMLFLILFAGHETTVNLLGGGLLALLQHPDQLARLKAEPDRLDAAIEELLRFTSPVQHVAYRYAIEDVTVGGTTIPRGSMLVVSIASANRDERVFPDPDRLDIAREPNRHIAFGFGVHYCLGAPLARLEAQIGFRVLLARCPDIELAVPAETLRWHGVPALRSLTRLPVRLHLDA